MPRRPLERVNGAGAVDINSRVLRMRTVLAVRLIPFVIAAVLAGCSSETTGVAPATRIQDAPPHPQSTFSVDCAASITTRVVHCGNSMALAAHAAVIIGGQNQFVTLTPSSFNTSLSDCPNAQAPDATKRCVEFNLTVTSLIPQPLGTADTTSVRAPHAEGVRVFVHAGPSAAAGVVIVANPDALGSFTGANQPYYQYNSVLQTNQTTPTKHWEFQYSPDVTNFTFTVLVSTAVPWPNGYIDGLGRVITLNRGEMLTLPGTVRSYVGTADAGAAIVFTLVNQSLASVTNGVITAAATDGATTMTAQSGLRPGRTTTDLAVCNSTVVVNGTNLPTTISSGDCFVAMSPNTHRPSTSFYGDLYRVTLSAGETLEIIMDTGNNLDSYLVLADRMGNVVDENDDDLDFGVGSRITYTATVGGVYVIQATTNTGLEVGGYTLGISIS
jgi:hypothetical protein